MNTSTEHILQCNQSEPQAVASGRIVDLMNENGNNHVVARVHVVDYLITCSAAPIRRGPHIYYDNHSLFN